MLRLVVGLFIFFTGCWEKKMPSSTENLSDLFHKPLITGASVSADYGTPSPGRRLSLRYSSAGNIKTIAKPGTMGRVIEPLISDEALGDRTIIIAMDFFFWDSTQANDELSREALQKLLAKIKAAKVPLVIGNIPQLLSGRQPSRASLNQAIEKACNEYEQCFLLRLDELHQQILRDGYLTLDGRNYSLRELVPDGLHLAERASEYLADKILEAIRKPGTSNSRI
jgi:hypothetical protein